MCNKTQANVMLRDKQPLTFIRNVKHQVCVQWCYRDESQRANKSPQQSRDCGWT